MTIKDDLHELVDELDEQDAREALAYLRALRELPSQPSPTFVEETQRALDEALEPEAVRLPHTDVRAWLQTWGTPEQDAASDRLDAVEERLRTEARRATNWSGSPGRHAPVGSSMPNNTTSPEISQPPPAVSQRGFS